MTVEQFIELVFEYGASGCKAVESYNDAQKETVSIAWAEAYDDKTNTISEEKIKPLFNSFIAESKWFVNYNEKDSSGYYTGIGGTIDCENKSFTSEDCYAMQFDTKEEAEEWCKDHAEEWQFGDLSVWSYN